MGKGHQRMFPGGDAVGIGCWECMLWKQSKHCDQGPGVRNSVTYRELYQRQCRWDAKHQMSVRGDEMKREGLDDGCPCLHAKECELGSCK